MIFVKESNMNTVYLDNAATSFPKPPSVVTAVEDCIKSYCANPGHSSHPLALTSAEKVFLCRERLASFFGSKSPENVIFTLNCTYALNMAIKGLVEHGDHILISDMEHNSVLRPVSALSRCGYIDYGIFPTVKDGKPMTAAEIRYSILNSIKPGRTKMLICAHIPNIASTVRPIEVIGDICRRNGIIFIVDAAQSSGHIRLDMKHANVDILCLPAHKGLFGLQGCGAMILGESCPPLATLTEGGNGMSSLEDTMPELPPERYEAGTLSTPSIVALSEGIDFLNSLPPKDVNRHEVILFNRLANALTSPRVKAQVYMPDCPGSVLLFNIPNREPDEIGHALSKSGICVRTGFHCSALGHRALGTEATGAVRASFGYFNKPEDVDRLYKTLCEYLTV